MYIPCSLVGIGHAATGGFALFVILNDLKLADPIAGTGMDIFMICWGVVMIAVGMVITYLPFSKG